METKWAPEEGQAMSELAEVSVAQFSELTARIYQGALESTPWASALELIRTSLGASYTTLILRSPSSDRRGLMVHA
ncbi:MAG: helix-turn-helix transcriptional regulator, partial [Paraburkholderia nemoris]